MADRIINCLCVSSTPDQWTDGPGGPDITDLVNELNALSTFEPKIGGMEFVQITVDSGAKAPPSRRKPAPKRLAGKTSARKRSPKKASAKKRSRS